MSENIYELYTPQSLKELKKWVDAKLIEGNETFELELAVSKSSGEYITVTVT